VPTIRLSSGVLHAPLPLSLPGGGTLQVPRTRFTCLAQLPRFMMPRDGIIDTGVPLTCFPLTIWSRFQEGTDFEWLPFEPGFQSPGTVMGNWRYTFRMARFLVPLTLMDYSTAIERFDVIAQFADNDPPARRGQSLPLFVIGLWGGFLEGGRVAVERTPAGQVAGTLECP
jgi:hypothetical protein